MPAPVEIEVYFNFRSPYCYLASKRLFDLEADDTRLLWYPLGGWAGRSPPERAKVKLPIARQDVRRWCRRMGIPFNPPPVTTDPTRAAAVSLLAEREHCLRRYTQAVMHAEWGEGGDIGDPEVLVPAAVSAGLGAEAVREAMDDPRHLARLEDNWERAQRLGATGVPTFIIGEDIFWGNDRIDFVEEHLDDLRGGRA